MYKKSSETSKQYTLDCETNETARCSVADILRGIGVGPWQVYEMTVKKA